MSMGSLFTLFSCCFARKPAVVQRETIPDENTHLIIPITVEPSHPTLTAYVVDQQKIKERMSSIVRSKEGKMVNVAAHLPFNLHNRKLSATMDNSSSSRSVSSSTTHNHHHHGSSLSLTFTPHSHSHSHVHVHPSTSRSSSVDSSSRETSNTSQTAPILNLRLVRGLPSFPSLSNGGAVRNSRRGRRKQRRGGKETADVDEDECAGDREEAIVVGGRWATDVLAASPVDSPGVGVDSNGEEKEEGTPRGVMDADRDHRTNEELRDHPTVSISPASTTSSVGFMLVDPGPLTVAWG